MSKKKNFTRENPALSYLSKTDNTQEVQEKVKATKPKTQGRKGKALPRINMAFYPDNHEYLKLISRLEGVSMTRYVNDLIAKDRLENQSVINKAQELFK